MVLFSTDRGTNEHRLDTLSKLNITFRKISDTKINVDGYEFYSQSIVIEGE